MEETNNDIELLRIESSLAANRVLLSCLRLRNALKYNPYWHLQPRAPAGSAHGVGGQWISGAINAALPILRFVGMPTIKLLREAIRRTAPYLRRSPRIWDLGDEFPGNEEFDKDTGRIGPPTPRRPQHPVIRFRSERELRNYLGPAGPGREWHHIVEKRLADKGIFPPEQIHSTDNIINLPVEVHRRVTARMSQVAPNADGRVLRSIVEEMSLEDQYNFGIRLIKEAYEELGYDFGAIQ